MADSYRYDPLEPHLLPWSETREERRLLYRTTGWTLGVLGSLFLLFTLVFEPAPVERQALEKVPARLAQVLLEKKAQELPPPPLIEETPPEPEEEPPKPEPKPEPKPAPTPEPKPEPKPEPPAPKAVPKPEPKPVSKLQAKPKPSAEQVQQARERAQQAGINKLQDQLSALRNLSKPAATAAKPIKQASANAAQRQERQLIGKRAEQGSGGIETTAVTARASQQLSGRSTTRIEGPADLARAEAQAAAAPAGPKLRSNSDVKLVFDRNAGAFYALYRRALRSNLGLEGRVVFDLAIRPDGRVEHCKIVSSGLGDADLERRLSARCSMIEFGEQQVERWQDEIAIDFAPQG